MEEECTKMALDHFAQTVMNGELIRAKRKGPGTSVAQITDNKKGPTFR
jgi:hypothetical protein